MKAPGIRIVCYGDDILLFATSLSQAAANEEDAGMEELLHRALRQRGYRGDFQRISMRSWRISASPLVSMALPNSWFREIGLVDLTKYSVGIVSQFYERR